MKLLAAVRLGFWSMVDMLLPRRCVVCGRRLALNEKHVCPHCVKTIAFNLYTDWTSNPRIVRWYKLRALQRMGAYTVYERHGTVARLIHQLKYNDMYELGEWMGRMAATDLKDTGLFDGVDALVPIPLSKQRMRKRGYNQAELIARGVSAITGIPVWTDVLKRRVNNKSQTKVEFSQRYTNAASIFGLKKQAASRLFEGCHVMIVDDVMTTGTTILSAIEALLTFPGVNVSTFTWAWTHAGSTLQTVAPCIDTQEDEQQQGEAPE